MTDLENCRKRLIYRSWHRGTREMDLLLGSFADRHVPGFGECECERYEQLLNMPDPDLYEWISGRVAPPASLMEKVLEMLLAHRFADPASSS